MLTTFKMEPAAHTVEALQVAALKEGRIQANLFRFSDSPEVGFRMWRWTKFRDGWKRGQLFQAADLERIFLIVRQIEEMASVPVPPEPRSVSLEFQEYAPLNLVQTFRHGNVQTFICDPKKPKQVEPFFVLRKTAAEPQQTANWFLTSDTSDLRKNLDQVRSWFQQLSLR